MYRRAPLIAWSFTMHLALMLLAFLFKPILWLWPYVFLLATQDVFGSPDDRSALAAMALGIVPVMLVAWFRQRRLDATEFETFDYAMSGLWTAVLTLAGLTGAAFLTANLLGWQVGV